MRNRVEGRREKPSTDRAALKRRRRGEQIGTMHLVLFALLRRGGGDRFVSTDEVAIEAFKLFPGKFCWDEFPHLPQWDRVRQWLSEAKKAKHGTLVEGFSGERRDGWRLTAAGVRLLRFKGKGLAEIEGKPAAEGDYRGAPATSLVVVALFELGKVAEFPVIVERCCMRFPLAFELPRYEGWPDSSRVREALHECIKLGHVVQGEAHGQYELAEKGESAAKAMLVRVTRSISEVTLAEVGRGLVTRAAQQVGELTNTRAWHAHRSGGNIGKAAACEAVQCSLQSHPKAVRRALENYFLAAEELGRTDVMEFLAECASAADVEMRTSPVEEGKEKGRGT
jgi:hypothetical protein